MITSEKFHWPLVAEMKLDPSVLKRKIVYENYCIYLSYESLFMAYVVFVGNVQNHAKYALLRKYKAMLLAEHYASG